MPIDLYLPPQPILVLPASKELLRPSFIKAPYVLRNPLGDAMLGLIPASPMAARKKKDSAEIFEVFFDDAYGDAINAISYGFTVDVVSGPNFKGLIFLSCGMTSNRTFSGGALEGLSLTELATDFVGTNNRISALVASGSPNNNNSLNYAWSGAAVRSHAGVFYVHGTNNPIYNGYATASGSDTSKSINVSVADGGYVLAFATGPSATPTLTGVTKLADSGVFETVYGVAAMAGPLAANASYAVGANTCRNLAVIVVNPG